jgi:cob(I)alamin adenosyltransferase
MKIYTKLGDQGKTQLFGGLKISKSDCNIEAYGQIDELNVFVGKLITSLSDFKIHFSPQINLLTRTQNYLFNIGSHLSCGDEKLRDKLPILTSSETLNLENQIDEMTEVLPTLKEFILPGGSPQANEAHVCRVFCRRAERTAMSFFEARNIDVQHENHFLIMLQYLNRLSDYFFTLARYINCKLSYPETTWNKDLLT